ncbi:MAG: TIGR02996 domain-containing protein [Myxococcales bacterium]|nr:TIGR02996 domain-containing protein [Myxococcales bacterium]
MVYLERPDINRFIVLERRASNVRSVAGRLGEAGRERVERFDDVEQAERCLWRRLRNLRHRGYQLGRQEPSMIASIAAKPDDMGRYLVYGDWLLQAQDPRGELIVTQARMAAPSLDEAQRLQLEGKQAELLRHERALLVPRDVVITRWRCGFAQHAATAPEPSELVHDVTRVLAAARWMLRHPTARFIERVDVEVARESAAALFAALLVAEGAAGGPRPRLLVVRTSVSRWLRQQHDYPGGETLDVYIGPREGELPGEIAATTARPDNP